MTKVQLSLTDEEAAILAGYGQRFGYSLPKVIRFIISKAAENAINEKTVPVYPMSEATEKRGLTALQESDSGKTKVVKNTDSYFDSL